MFSTAPVELLERAIGYTRGTLAAVHDDLLSRRTPCAEWDLAALLAHMGDGLAAFTEASSGVVALAPDPRPATTVEQLRTRACALLAAWSAPAAPSAYVGGARLDVDVLLPVAALEVAVHGWDVGQATGAATPIPAALAADLLPVAHRAVTAQDRGTRFADPVPVAGAGATNELLALVGRRAASGRMPANP
ncbi:TIGR03086 family metal-binding protein [Nocardioides sp. AE5]|uniref:TIGR03086 family metal-binding protein n=1 Tax=Nocardioides sp. AE5 TaxID=2962573 RepID=UPI002880E68E|nr:TIGR03086 family metal-binding protein [Nocardioides sp. AE5]MDT0203039.1 TIGR03086 family metal-binding protein [Nocardioides sp. AE5]